MKVFLMYRDKDFDRDTPPGWTEPELMEDLELATLVAAMAGDDEFLQGVARRGLLSELGDPAAILYRQDVLRDFLARPELLADLYAIASEATVAKPWQYLSRLFRSPESTLFRSTQSLKKYVTLLPTLRQLAEQHVEGVQSEGLSRLFRVLIAELDDAYLAEVDQHLRNLDLRKAVHMSASLGDGLADTDFVLHPPRASKSRWFEWIEWLDGLRVRGDRSYIYSARSHNDRGLRDLADLREEGIALVSEAVDQASEHLLSFLQILRAELGFYVGCVALRDALVTTGNPTCFPIPAAGDATLACRGLYDPCLALTTGRAVVGNDVEARDARLIVVTGANQGGKSTFLRSVGVAQLMAQAGMFAPADALEVSPCSGLFTHFRREEDATMTSGKLDEECTRMSAIVDHLTPGALVLFNESFAATNEREGSHVSREVVLALIESGLRVVYVTHLYDLAHGLYRDRLPGTVFLRAPRNDDGTRSFRLVEGAPLPTSFGRDVYERVFGGAADKGGPAG